MSNQRSETLVMGAAVGYGRDRIAPFLTTLRKCGYRGDVLLLVDRRLVSQASADPLFEGVSLLAVPQWLPVRFGLFGGGRRSKLLPAYRLFNAIAWTFARLCLRAGILPARVAGLLLPPTESRFLVFRECLRASGHRRVLISDVRDVVFQRDPFSQLPPAGLCVSMEVPTLTLSSEPHNARWLQLVYGQSVLEAIGSRPISCSGVTAGSRESVTHYLEAMAGEMLRMPLRAVGHSGVDQGIHNHLLWSGALGEVIPLETFASAVATLGIASESELRFDAQDRLLNRDGGVIAIVHQYDRIPRAREALLRAQVAASA
jgi:hypothetical protein